MAGAPEREGDGPASWFLDIFGPHQVTTTVEQLRQAARAEYLDLDHPRDPGEGGLRRRPARRPWRQVPDHILASVRKPVMIVVR